MKYFLYLLLLLSLNFGAIAQDTFEKFSVNFGLTHAILNEHRYKSLKYRLDPEIEALVNFRIFESIRLSAGIGFQYGEHNIIEEVNHLIWVEGIGWRPTEYNIHLYFDFLSNKAPIYFTVPLKNFFLNSIIAGTSFGYFSKLKITESSIQNFSKNDINRLFLDLSFGLNKYLFQHNKISVGFSPFLGYRAYLSDYNDTQRNYIFYQLKFNINFKTLKP